MAMDPGGTTGVAWGIFDLSDTIAHALRTKRRAGSESFKGDPVDQIHPLAKLWGEFRNLCHFTYGIPVDQIDLVIEDWIVRPKVVLTGHTPVLPVMISWGVIGYRMGARDEYENNYRGPTAPLEVIWQQPGPAMNLGTSARLKSWDCWPVGRPHEREAWCHVALRIATLLGQS